LLKALPLLRKKGISFHLTLVGHIDKEYEEVIQPYLTGTAITHIAHVANNEIYELMRQQDLFVMPSIEDGFGIVVAEALSVHLPVIVTSNCGASEIVTNGENGFVIDAFSERAICEAIMRSIDYSFCFQQKPAGWKAYATQLEQFYTAVLN
jgi:glycosyltransferase involved in cell wall biosynthesis